LEPKTFAELGLSPKVQAAIDAAGYTTPTPIQAAAIPIAISGRDVLGIAQTGTGKTASFVLPMITRLETGRARARMPRSSWPLRASWPRRLRKASRDTARTTS
jgi:superfamily II DNA/RNA helicase